MSAVTEAIVRNEYLNFFGIAVLYVCKAYRLFVSVEIVLLHGLFSRLNFFGKGLFNSMLVEEILVICRLTSYLSFPLLVCFLILYEVA